MGLLVKGKWQNEIQDEKSIKMDGPIRDWITKDGKPYGDKKTYPAEKGRYHLYVSLACPWASRSLMVRKIKGLEDLVGLSIVNPIMSEKGWSFEEYEGSTKDKLYGLDFMKDIYTKSKEDYTGKVTVPVLFDTVEEKIVNNESADIIRIFNHAFDDLGAKDIDLYPEDLRSEIDEINEFVLDRINSGVYKAGLAKTQEDYEKEVKRVFEGLDKIEEILSKNKFLLGENFTEADIRLFTSLVRFDPVYYHLFKCNLRPLTSYKNIWRYTREIYHIEGIAETVDIKQIKEHYYKADALINREKIVPLGPEIDFSL